MRAASRWKLTARCSRARRSSAWRSGATPSASICPRLAEPCAGWPGHSHIEPQRVAAVAALPVQLARADAGAALQPVVQPGRVGQPGGIDRQLGAAGRRRAGRGGERLAASARRPTVGSRRRRRGRRRQRGGCAVASATAAAAAAPGAGSCQQAQHSAAAPAGCAGLQRRRARAGAQRLPAAAHGPAAPPAPARAQAAARGQVEAVQRTHRTIVPPTGPHR